MAATRSHVIRVKAGDAKSLIESLEEANKLNADTLSERTYVLIPDGTYDLGETSLTTISGHNIALIGQSMEKTIIVNAPKVENEGISTTATLLNRGCGTYVQDLTLKNALDYYNSGPAGRAVCWQDKGNRTIFKRVRMLSYQDTYYSHSEECQHYFEDCEIHGTVDFLCGAGDVYFNRCLVVTEKCKEGAEKNVIAAPRTSVTEWGYVFNGCTIRNIVSPFYLARAWHTHPRCVWLNTRLETPQRLLKERYDPHGLRTVDNEFFEFHTTDVQGRDITPQTNVVNFICKEESRQVETIMKADVARKYTLENIFPGWRPELLTRELFLEVENLRKAYR